MKLPFYESPVKCQRMTWTSCTHNLHVLIKTILCTNFRPKSSIPSMKSHVPAFSHIRHCNKKVKVNQRSSFVNFKSNQVSRPLVNGVWRNLF